MGGLEENKQITKLSIICSISLVYVFGGVVLVYTASKNKNAKLLFVGGLVCVIGGVLVMAQKDYPHPFLNKRCKKRKRKYHEFGTKNI